MDPAESVCTYVPFGNHSSLQVAYSNSPKDGISVIYQKPPPGLGNASLLPSWSLPATDVPSGFGLEVESLIACTGQVLDSCTDGVQILMSPVEAGLTLLFYVETTNTSATGKGAFRREYYPTLVNSEEEIVPVSTTCSPASFNSSFVQVSSFYHHLF